MFISKEEVQKMTGVVIDNDTLQLAQAMIEIWVGKAEEEVEQGSDFSKLGRATAFQAVYIQNNKADIIEQAAVKQLASGEGTVTFDTAMFAPYISPWAVRACKSLSWKGTRTVHTGKTFDNQRTSYYDWWVRT